MIVMNIKRGGERNVVKASSGREVKWEQDVGKFCQVFDSIKKLRRCSFPELESSKQKYHYLKKIVICKS